MVLKFLAADSHKIISFDVFFFFFQLNTNTELRQMSGSFRTLKGSHSFGLECSQTQ